MTALVTGATGFVGDRLARALLDRGEQVRCVVRKPERAAELEGLGAELHKGDALDADSLKGAGEGVDTAYYLIHSMGGGEGGDFSQRERSAAENFARMAKAEGVQRMVYLGGLGDPTSEHLRSRQVTADVLAEQGPPLTYFRAGMVVGAGSASFQILYHLVRRLPVMVTPSWLRTRTQPIGIDDVIAFLSADAPAGEVQIGGPDVLAYEDMLDVVADALGRRAPLKLPVPLLSPRLSSLWVGLVTPADPALARALIDSLEIETVVTDPAAMERFDVRPAPFAETVRKAVRASR